MGIKEMLISKSRIIRDDVLIRKYGSNIHDIDLKETIKTGIEDKLMKARELGVPYCVIFGHVVPTTPRWDPYGNGDWNPPREYITTDDIATEDNDREQEKENIYSFLRGEVKKDKINRTK